VNLLEDQAKKVTTDNFDFQKMAGPMQGATSMNVDDNMLASKQLEGILSRDNPLLQKARARAGAASARRGLMNSSIGVEAGESAMIDAAMPLATQDASTYARAGEFNANAQNQFALEGNRFGRETAVARFNNLGQRENQERDHAFKSSENLLDRAQQSSILERELGFRAGESALERAQRLQEQANDQTFRTGERIGSQEFTAGQSALDRTFQSTERQADRTFQRDERIDTQKFQAGENAVQRAFQTGERIADQDFRGAQAVLDREQQLRVQQLQESGMDRRQAESLAAQERENKAARIFTAEQAQVDRDFRSEQAGLDRTHQESMTRLNAQLQMDAEKWRVPTNMVGQFQASMQDYISKVMADGNLSGEAKEQAIKNYYAYSQQTMGWMSSFFGQEMPNMGTPPPSTSGGTTGGTSSAGGIPNSISPAQYERNKSMGLPDTFNPEIYLKNNPDVAAAVQAGQMTAEEHWQRWGRNETRRNGTWTEG